MADLTHTPDWVKNAVFYQIFPDRFAKSDTLEKPTHIEPWHSPLTRHGFKGGDLLGVYEKLDYLQDLGINAIYFNPIFMSAANHRYHTFDYFQVDPILGAIKHFLSSWRKHIDGIFVLSLTVFSTTPVEDFFNSITYWKMVKNPPTLTGSRFTASQ